MRRHADVFMTTQPGWAFATLAELRARGVHQRLPFYHRDSSVLAPGSDQVLGRKLMTPAEVFGCVVQASATGDRDATHVLRDRLDHSAVKEEVLGWLPLILGTHRRRYSIAAEVYGDTRVERRVLARIIDNVIQRAFPRWNRAAGQGLRFYCKADPESAVLGVQLYSNLSRVSDGRAGALRDHLAGGLLTIGGAEPGTPVFDPFMGTGTILDVAIQGFGVTRCYGLEVDTGAYDMAKSRVSGPGASLSNTTFEDFDSSSLSPNTLLVSNVPFGAQFQRVPSDRLVSFLRDVSIPAERMVMLMSRGQAQDVAPQLGLRVKNVLVLGRKASILHYPGDANRVPRNDRHSRQ